MATPPPDLARWRKVMREELIARRLAASPEQRREWDLAISLQLTNALPLESGTILGFCWPYKGEYDARPLLRLLRGRGVRCALPVIKRRNEPLIFRLWWPGVAMTHGPLGIACPVDTPVADPEVVLVPLVGFGRAGDRLGYGGGYFDRTLASLARKPLCIGVGYELARIESSFPQPHDVPMDAIVTESAARWREGGTLVDLSPRELRARLIELERERVDLTRLMAHTVPGDPLDGPAR